MVPCPTNNEQPHLTSFANNPSVSVFLISLKAGGVGLNLTAANRVYLMDIWWNPAAEDQAVDRVHRLGQTKSVDVVRMIVRGGGGGASKGTAGEEARDD